MKEQNKKRIIAGLLFIGCLISGYMLYATGPGTSRTLESVAQADSLIKSELTSFNIQQRQINVRSVRVDSNFVRKVYRVGVPYQFSKTQFHAELNNLFYNYGISTPAKVTFPEENMNIHLYANNTVIRTVTLQTDPDLRYERNRMSLLVLFDEIPGEDFIQQLESLGEPIPIIIKVTDPMRAKDITKRLGSRYQRLSFWLQNKDGEDLLSTNTTAARKILSQFEDILPKARLIYLSEQRTKPTAELKEILFNTDIHFINAENALMLGERRGEAGFRQTLDNLLKNPERSIAVIEGNETTLAWLKQVLPAMKKEGGEIIPPPNLN